MIGTSVMKDLRRSSPFILRKSFLKRCKADLAFLISFCLDFFSRIFTINRTAGEGRSYLFTTVLPLPPASQTLRHQLGNCCIELTSAYSWQPESNREHLIFYCMSLIAKLRALQNSLFPHLDWQLLLLGECLKLR